MIHIAITAGGTEEPIDGIRKITNMSSGSLGWHCLEAVLSYMEKQNRTDFMVHYIKAPKSVTKELNTKDAPYVDFIDVTNTQSVYDCIGALMNEVNIGVFIHAMAISDFSYSYSASIADLAEELFQTFVEDKSISKEKIEAILTNPIHKHSAGKKI